MSAISSRLTNVDSATVIGGITALGVYMIYNNALPHGADVQSAMPHDETIESCRKGAAIKSAVLVGATFIIARDLNSFIISGAALVGMDLYYKRANAVHPSTGKIDTSTSGTSISDSNVYPLTNYNEADGA